MGANKVLVVLGSVRDGRLGLPLAKFMIRTLEQVGLAPTLIDPQDYDIPVLKQPFHWMSPDQQAKAPEWMKLLDLKFKEADGFVLVAPEYNCTVAPALTNLLDYFPPANFRHKPVSIVTYSMGSFGGVRARVALLPFIGELGMVCLPSGVTVPSIKNVGFTEDGTTTDERVIKNAEKLSKELQWFVTAVAEQKVKTNGFPN